MKKFGSITNSSSITSQVSPVVLGIPTAIFNSSVNSNNGKAKKNNWPVVSARIPNELRKRLVKMYPKRGDLSEVIFKLLNGHIMGWFIIHE